MKLPFGLFSRSRDDRTAGQALVEFALVLPVFVLLVVMAVDFGRLYYSHIQITNAAREGANYGAQHPAETAKITARALAETSSQGQKGENAPTVTTTCANQAGAAIACTAASGGTGPGNTLTVAVREQFTFITPLVNNFFNNNLVMSSSATSTVRGYAASSSGPPPGSCSLPVPDFTVVITSGLTIHVDPQASRPNSGICNISGFNWTWGDGETSVGVATGDDHTYLAAGTYTVKLEVTNQAGAVEKAATVTVPATGSGSCAKPVANFSFTRGGAGNKTYTFKDLSTTNDPVNCPLKTWTWAFDDGTGSGVQNPTYTYQTGGNHQATLVVTSAGGSSNPVTLP
jgi:PKD repeat protein